MFRTLHSKIGKEDIRGYDEINMQRNNRKRVVIAHVDDSDFYTSGVKIVK